MVNAKRYRKPLQFDSGESLGAGKLGIELRSLVAGLHCEKTDSLRPYREKRNFLHAAELLGASPKHEGPFLQYLLQKQLLETSYIIHERDRRGPLDRESYLVAATDTVHSN